MPARRGEHGSPRDARDGAGEGWDLPSPFVIAHTVAGEEIDALGHANNAAYLRWCERCAWAHTEAEGLDLAAYRRLGSAMAVRHTTLDYLRACFAGERLLVGNWIVASDGRLRVTRRYQVRREADGESVLRGRSEFVCIDLASGRPRRMPPAFAERYRVREDVAAALAGGAG